MRRIDFGRLFRIDAPVTPVEQQPLIKYRQRLAASAEQPGPCLRAVCKPGFSKSRRSTKARSTDGTTSTALVTVQAQCPQVIPSTFSFSMMSSVAGPMP
jgi:hypothetical protein